MAKARRSTQVKLDMMSITVLLVMAIFGGLVGYHLGKSAGAAQMMLLKESAVMMKEKAAFMQEAGEMMEDRGGRWRDTEMMEKGKMMSQDGSTMMGKADGMMGMMGSGY